MYALLAHDPCKASKNFRASFHRGSASLCRPGKRKYHLISSLYQKSSETKASFNSQQHGTAAVIPSFTKVDAWSAAARAATSSAAELHESFCVLLTTSFGTCTVTPRRSLASRSESA